VAPVVTADPHRYSRAAARASEEIRMPAISDEECAQRCAKILDEI